MGKGLLAMGSEVVQGGDQQCRREAAPQQKDGGHDGGTPHPCCLCDEHQITGVEEQETPQTSQHGRGHNVHASGVGGKNG